MKILLFDFLDTKETNGFNEITVAFSIVFRILFLVVLLKVLCCLSVSFTKC